MKRINKLIRPIIIALCFVITLSFIPWMSEDFTVHASVGKIKMTVYDEVIKNKNTVYCAGARGIYKVKLRKGRVKSKKLLKKSEPPMYKNIPCISSMRKSGGYIYYMHATPGGDSMLYRVKIKTGKGKYLAGLTGEVTHYGYVIKGKKIYYEDMKWDEKKKDEIECVKSMNLSGSGKKLSSAKPRMSWKRSNAKGYKVVVKKKGKYAKDYLKTPKGTFYLGRIKLSYPEYEY